MKLCGNSRLCTLVIFVGGVIFVLGFFLLLTGCALPPWRVFQKSVPANQSEKPARQIEGEKQGAALIRELTTPPVADPIHAVQQVHEVALGLTASLGEPEKPVRLEDQAAVIAALRAGNAAKEHQLDEWKKFGRKYGGKELEDTGVNLAGPAGVLGLLGVIAACVLCPAFGYLLLRVVPLLWGFFRQTTAGISTFIAAHPEAGEQLKTALAKKMDEAQKRLVRVRGASAPSTST